MNQICPKWIKVNQIGFLNNQKCYYKSCHIYHEDEYGYFIFDLFLDQICSKWIKLDQIGFSCQSKNVTMKSCHIFRKDKNGCLVFDFFGSDLSKMDQT